MAHAFQIDTLAFSKKLKAAGADERLAEAIVEGITGADISELATKADIREVKTEIADVKAELKAEIADVKAELKADIAEVKASIAEVKASIAEVKASIDLLASTLIVKLGVMMVGGFSLLAVLFGVLGYLLKP